jgi:hypothetical protein
MYMFSCRALTQDARKKLRFESRPKMAFLAFEPRFMENDQDSGSEASKRAIEKDVVSVMHLPG